MTGPAEDPGPGPGTEPPSPRLPLAVMVNGRPEHWASLGALRETCELYRASGEVYDIWQWFEGRWLVVEAGGPGVNPPVGWRRMPGRPVEDGPGSVRRFLWAIRAEPHLLPEAPPGAPAGTGRASATYRVHDEVHWCLRCGAEPTGVAVVAHPPGPGALWPGVYDVTGDRWLDLCHRCYGWLLAGMPEAEAEEERERWDKLWETLGGL